MNIRFGRVIGASSVICVMVSVGCGQKPPNHGDEHINSVLSAADKKDGRSAPITSTKSSQSPSKPLTLSVAGVDTSKLDEEESKRAAALFDSLPSPCRKPHSLRTSVEKDKDCKAAKHAAQYVVELVRDAADKDAKLFYQARYGKDPVRVTLNVAGAPMSGAADGKVKIVEFYDYACGHCKLFDMVLRDTMKVKGKVVSVHYKMFPLPTHPNSGPAAQAAIAAFKQGKFKELHTLLFKDQRAHSKTELFAHAQSLGLDMTKFEADYNAAAARVQADTKQGDAIGVSGTPTVFLNGRRYRGPIHPKYLSLWIDEELEIANR